MDENELWQRVERIFHSALEHSGIARTEHVRRECEGDDELRRRVESLLDCDAGALPLDGPKLPEPQVHSFGRYHLISKLGEGGMGTVYLARDRQLNRDVALKTLPSTFSLDAERRRRFLREARAASALSHPNIVPIYDFGGEGEVEYYVMEYVRGKPLDRLIPRTGLKLEEALDYAIPIASALGAAHEAGIVHRDVKPGNIIVDDRGVPKLLDFGIARLAEGLTQPGPDAISSETAEGTVIGTVAYMSPEQAQGQPVDGRSDIFSFGSLLFEMVTGHRTFQRESDTSTLAAILRDDPPPANSLVQDLPPPLCAVLEGCLRKDPAQRFQRMADVLIELTNVRAGLRPSGRRLSRNGVAVAFACLVLSAAAVVWYVQRSKAHRTAGPWTDDAAAPTEAGLRLIPLTTYPGEETSPSFSPDGNQIAFTYREPGNLPSHIFIKLIGQNDAVQLTRGADADLYPAWSPDGLSIAFLRHSGPMVMGWALRGKWTLMSIPSIGGPERRVAELDEPDCPGPISWHPAGKWIALVDRSETGLDAIYIHSMADGTRRQLTTPPVGNRDQNPAFSPDGTRLAFTHGATDIGNLFVMDLTEQITAKNAPRRLTFENGFVGTPAWTGDGRSILFSGGSNHSPTLWRIWIQPSGSEPRTPQRISGAGVGVRSVAVSSKGLLAFSSDLIDADIWRVDLTKRAAGRLGSDYDTRVVASTRVDHTVQYSPDGNRLAFASERSGTHEIWVSNAEGKQALRLTSFGGPYTADPYWSPDGHWISFSSRAGGVSAVYKIPAQGGAMKRVTEGPAHGGAWTPDGQWIYCQIKDQLWKVPAAGGSPVQITRNKGAVRAESPDGRTVYYLKEDSEISSLWTVEDGGEERQILPAVFSHNFVARKEGIYFVPGPEKPAIWFYSFADGKTRMLAPLRSVPAFGMDVSKDGRTALVPEYEDPGSDIMMIENFH